MQNELLKWLESGDIAPLQSKNGDTFYIVVRVPVNENFDYLFCQRHYHSATIERSDSFKYGGIYCKADGLLYDVQYELRKRDDEDCSRSKEKLREKLEAEVRALIEATIANDRKNLTITELPADDRHDMAHYIKHTAPEIARRDYLDMADDDTPEPLVFISYFKPEHWTETSLLEYILAPAEYAKRTAAEYIKAHQEDILCSFLQNDAIAAAYAEILNNPKNNVHTVKKIRSAVMESDAKSVTVTVRRDDKEVTFKYEARILTSDCTNKYNAYNADATGRRALEKTFGRGADDFRPHEIVRITYGRKTIYEAGLEK